MVVILTSYNLTQAIRYVSICMIACWLPNTGLCQIDWLQPNLHDGYLIRYLIVNDHSDRFSGDNWMNYEVILSNDQYQVSYFDSLFHATKSLYRYTHIYQRNEVKEFIHQLDSSLFLSFGGCFGIEGIGGKVVERPGKQPAMGCVFAKRFLKVGYTQIDGPLQSGIYFIIEKVSFWGKVSWMDSFEAYKVSASYGSRYTNALGFYDWDSFRAQIPDRVCQVFGDHQGYPVMTILELCYHGPRKTPVRRYNSITCRKCRRLLKKPPEFDFN